jgi:hypothetical protein
VAVEVEVERPETLVLLVGLAVAALTHRVLEVLETHQINHLRVATALLPWHIKVLTVEQEMVLDTQVVGVAQVLLAVLEMHPQTQVVMVKHQQLLAQA